MSPFRAHIRGVLTRARAGSPWGSGTFAGVDGSRQPSALELELAGLHGQQFYGVVSKVNFSA